METNEMTAAEMAARLTKIEEELADILVRLAKPDFSDNLGLWESVATATHKTRSAKDLMLAQVKE